MVACSLVIEVQYRYVELDFHELENCEKSISHQHTIFISAECPFHTLGLQVAIIQHHKNL